MRINPAILVDEQVELSRQLFNAANFTDEVDIDVIDWQRTPTKTVTVQDILATQELNLLLVNFDLMVDEALPIVQNLLRMSKTLQRIIVNVYAHDDLQNLARMVHASNIEFGISLNPESSPRDYLHLFKDLDLIQIMTVEPGKQGNSFQEQSLQKVLQIKALDFPGKIEIDGGIAPDTIKKALDLPIDILSVGSYISKSANPAEAYAQLQNIIS